MGLLTFILILFLYCDVRCYLHESKGFNVTDKLTVLYDLGKKDYENIQKKGETSSCWAESIKYMIVGCKNLTEHVQMNIALRYSDCFVTSCGLNSHGCALLSDVERKHCIQKMTPEGFHAYVGFFISLQNICFFLESERWHNRTKDNVNNLMASSALMAQNLEESNKFKSSLLYNQRQTIHLQNKFHQSLSTLKFVFTKYEEVWNSTVEKYTSVTSKQEKLILTVYDVFSVLNEWAVERFYWLGTTMFYIVSVACMLAFTVQTKLRSARLRVVIVLTANVLLEKILYSCLFQGRVLKEAEELYQWIWVTRKITVVLCIILIFASGYNNSHHSLFSYKWICSINSQLNALRVSLEKQNKNGVDSGGHLCHISSDKIRIPYNLPSDSCSRTGKAVNTPITRCNDVKATALVSPDSSVPSLRRYNLRMRNTPPIDTSTATAL